MRMVLIHLFVTSSCEASDFAQGNSRPNVLMYISDDWPYELWPTRMTGDRGQPNNYTALLPSFSKHFVDDGLEVKNMYTQPMSAPSRRTLFSGRFMTHVGKPFGQINSLSTRISTLGERLKSAGYETAFYGKWFLGGSLHASEPSQHPAPTRALPLVPPIIPLHLALVHRVCQSIGSAGRPWI